MIIKIFKPKTTSNSLALSSHPCPAIHNVDDVNPSRPSGKDKMLDLGLLESDPAKRKQISDYSPNLRDRVRRYYINKGPCKRWDRFVFPITYFGNKPRSFHSDWFDTSYSGWLEYSIEKDAAFCLCCYLFKNETGGHGKQVGDPFTVDGFRSWNKGLERLNKHVGEVNSVHYRCFKMMLYLDNQAQSILTCFDKENEKLKANIGFA
ncbi:uncharacterized protein LOC132043368 [Lycium ferocissimum]|uniref:uncharacterized protein LOC132043368 n=1 Tax=Lycium ferocissimum TaxID=112874 RepID=UPI0028169C97|nr:uncharacterized protein LOC132043368 [Lycium ferocissimum]